MSSIPTHVNGFYLRTICLSAYLLGKKNTQKRAKIQKTPSEKNVRDCSSVYSCIVVSANKITAKGCDFFELIFLWVCGQYPGH